MFRLRSGKVIQKVEETDNDMEYAITDLGLQKLADWDTLYRQYEDSIKLLLNDKHTADTTCDNSVDFEKAFGNFLDRREYDEFENAVFSIVRAAFTAGWKSAGGNPPQPQTILSIVKRQKGND